VVDDSAKDPVTPPVVVEDPATPPLVDEPTTPQPQDPSVPPIDFEPPPVDEPVTPPVVDEDPPPVVIDPPGDDPVTPPVVDEPPPVDPIQLPVDPPPVVQPPVVDEDPPPIHFDPPPIDEPTANEPLVVSGIIFNDIDGDGVQDAGEAGLWKRNVFADVNNNWRYDKGEPRAVTDRNGKFELTLDAGEYTIRASAFKGWRKTEGKDGIKVKVSADDPIEPIDFGQSRYTSQALPTRRRDDIVG
jgi:hypothetical protein